MKRFIQLNMEEMCVEYGLTHEVIQKFISEEWITPYDLDLLLFDDEDLARVGLICELKNNLGVNDEAMTIILHLIDQLNLVKRMRTNI